MYEIRIHGLGGQGVVTMTEILAAAAFYNGWQAQAFPSYGPERTGAAVTGYVRLDRQPIKVRQQIYTPDLIIVLNDKLLDAAAVASGAKPNAKLLINTARDIKDISHITNIPAKNITICSPQNLHDQSVNMFILGCAAKTFNLANLANCRKALQAKLADKGQEIVKNNLTALQLGYDS